MEKFDFEKLGKDLKNIRERMEVLESRKKKFSFPGNIGYLSYRLRHDWSLSKYNSLKKKINQNYNSLKEYYPKLRELYSDRGNHLELEELLTLNQIKTERICDLEERKQTLLSMKKKGFVYFFQNKKVAKLVKDVDTELDRRERNRWDIVEEVAERGYDMEVICTQNMMDNIYKN